MRHSVVLRVRGPKYSKLGGDIGTSKALNRFVSDFLYVASFRNETP